MIYKKALSPLSIIMFIIKLIIKFVFMFVSMVVVVDVMVILFVKVQVNYIMALVSVSESKYIIEIIGALVWKFDYC